MFDLLAQTTGPTAPSTFLQSAVQAAPLVLAGLVLFYFLSSTKRKDEKSRKAMIDQLKKGDRVQTIGGILGTILSADGDEVLVKVDESSNTKIRFTRTAVHRVITADSKVDAK